MVRRALASVALLLGSRAVWAISLVFAVSGAGIIGRTFVHTRGMLEEAEKKIAEAQKREAFMEDEDGDGKADAPAPSGGAGAKEPPKGEPPKKE